MNFKRSLVYFKLFNVSYIALKDQLGLYVAFFESSWFVRLHEYLKFADFREITGFKRVKIRAGDALKLLT